MKPVARTISLNTLAGFLLAAVCIAVAPNGTRAEPEVAATDRGDNITAVAASGTFVYAVGFTEGSMHRPNPEHRREAFVRKYQENGTLLWGRQFGGADPYDAALGVAADTAGNAYVVGYAGTEEANPGSLAEWDGFLRKYNASGALQWSKRFRARNLTGKRKTYASAVAVDGNGYAYVVGSSAGNFGGPSQGGFDVFVQKYSPAGDVLWTRLFGTPRGSQDEPGQDDYGTGIAVDSGGNVFVVGYTNGGAFPGFTNNQETDAFVRKYDTDGVELWTRQFGTNADDLAHAVAVDTLGRVIVAGITDGSFPGFTKAGNSDAFVRKYHGNGTLMFTDQFGTVETDHIRAVAADPRSDYYVAGWTDGALSGANAGFADVFVRKYAPNNTPIWLRQFGSSSGEDATGIVAPATNKIYVGGSTGGALGGPNQGSNDPFLRRLNALGNAMWTKQ
jgi:hypothetical protein